MQSFPYHDRRRLILVEVEEAARLDHCPRTNHCRRTPHLCPTKQAEGAECFYFFAVGRVPIGQFQPLTYRDLEKKKFQKIVENSKKMVRGSSVHTCTLAHAARSGGFCCDKVGLALEVGSEPRCAPCNVQLHHFFCHPRPHATHI